MNSTVACPECGAASAVLDSFEMYSTDGPIEHLRISCENRHHFTLPADRVVAYRAPAERRAS